MAFWEAAWDGDEMGVTRNSGVLRNEVVKALCTRQHDGSRKLRILDARASKAGCRYPAHILASMLQASPWTTGLSDPHTMVTKWSLVVARGLDNTKCVDHCRKDMASMGHKDFVEKLRTTLSE